MYIGIMNLVQYWIQDNILMVNEDKKNIEIEISNRYDYIPILDVASNLTTNDEDDYEDDII
jgi:hypothetical protein